MHPRSIYCRLAATPYLRNMPCDPIDLEMLAVAHRTYLRTPPCSRRLVEDYIDWLTAQLAEQAAACGKAPKPRR